MPTSATTVDEQAEIAARVAEQTEPVDPAAQANLDALRGAVADALAEQAAQAEDDSPEVAAAAAEVLAPEQPTRTLAEKVLLASAAIEVNDQLAARVTDMRAEVVSDLKALAKATGMKGAVDAKLPDGTKVASFTLNEPKDKAAVSGPTDFAAWVEEQFPSEIEYVPTVRSSFQKALLDKGVALFVQPGQFVVEDSGEVVEVPANSVVHKKTGQIIPGLRANPAGEPNSISVRFAPGGRDKVGEAFADHLGELLGAPAAIGPAAGPSVVDGTVVETGEPA